MPVSTLITAGEFALMSFDVPVELVSGEIVEMTRPGAIHGLVCIRVSVLLDSWSQRKQESEYVAFANDTGVLTRQDPDSVRGPDVFVIHRNRLPGGKIPEGYVTVTPDLCVEVRSPHDRWSSIIQKVSEYLAMGVREVWVIDPESRHVHVYHIETEPDVLEVGSRLRSQSLPEFECGVEEFFRGL